MKHILFLISLLLITSFANANRYISLKDGTTIESVDGKPFSKEMESLDDGILVTYTFHYVTIATDPLYSNSVLLQMNGFVPNTKVGLPSIPQRIDSFAIPEGSVVEVSVVDTNYIDLPLCVSPARPLLSDNSYSGYTQENVLPIKSYRGFFPTVIVSKTDQMEYRGTYIARYCIQPFQYDYENQTVRAYSKISYKVTFCKANNNSLKAKISADDHFLNNTTISKESTERRKNESTVKTNGTSIVKDYLIITVPEFLEAVEKFSQWKRLLGYNVIVSIRNTWTSDEVMNEVSSKYNACDNLYYLLIVGSHSQINGKLLTEPLYPARYSDYYYGCMGGPGDRLSDISVGRLPVTSLQEANTVVDKIINYEKAPVMDQEFYKNGLVCAHFICDNSNHELRRYTQTAERIRDYLSSKGKTAKRVYYAYPDDDPKCWTSWAYYYGSPNDSIPWYLQRDYFNWDGDADNIIDSINNGAFFVLHRDHGEVGGWIQPQFNLSHLTQLENGEKLPVVFSVNCFSGQYYNSENRCFADSMLIMSNGGAVSVIAPMFETGSGTNDALTEGMFESIWPEPGLLNSFGNPNYTVNSLVPEYEMGKILSQGLFKMEELYFVPMNDSISCQWTREFFHCFGDPSMEIRTELPENFSDINISATDNSISVDLGNEIGRISFCDSVGNVVSYEGNSAYYSGISSGTTVCIYAHNKIPYIVTPLRYIQNETMCGNKTINANVIKVGSNVTSTMPTGPVEFNGGEIKLNGNTVEIYGETTVTLGTTLTINNQ